VVEIRAAKVSLLAEIRIMELCEEEVDAA